MCVTLCLESPCSVHKHHCTCCTPQPGPSSATTEKTHWHLVAKEHITDNMEHCRCLSARIYAVERCSVDWIGKSSKQLLQKRWSQWKIQCRLESTCRAAGWYRNWNEVGQQEILQRYQDTITSKTDISEQKNSSITFICTRQAETRRVANKLLG